MNKIKWRSRHRDNESLYNSVITVGEYIHNERLRYTIKQYYIRINDDLVVAPGYMDLLWDLDYPRIWIYASDGMTYDLDMETLIYIEV